MKRPKKDNRKPKEQLAKGLEPLAKELGLEADVDYFDWVWKELEDHYVTDDLECEAIDVEKALKFAKRSLRRYNRARHGGSSSSGQGRKQKKERGRAQDVPVEPTERERDATNALSKYLAAHAAMRPLVQRFRREDLPGGKLLTRDDEIGGFLAVELAGLPDGELDFAFDPQPDTEVCFDVNYHSRDEEIAQTPKLAEYIGKLDREEERQLEEDWEGPPGWHLQKLGQWLMRKYPWQVKGDVWVFLLSGRPPRLAESIRVDRYKNDTYSITYSPWVSEATVLNAYHATRRSHRQALGNDKTVRVLRFVAEQADQEGRLPLWEQMRTRWNAANPADRFENRDGIWRAYKRAVEALVPTYLPPLT